MSTKRGEWIAFLQGVNRLYEHKFGHPPTDATQDQATHFIMWRFGHHPAPNVLVDAIARIRELEATK